MSLKMLTKDRRFWPLFWTQFQGALSDNILKNALVMMVTYQGITIAGMDKATIVALSGGIFILPFFLFSPIAGQVADKFEKSWLVRITKYWELAIMAVAAIGFCFHLFSLLLFVLFLAGVQATLFGPVKYSMLPDLVSEQELVEANAYVEMGTFLAILLGTIAGGTLVGFGGGEYWIAGALIGLSLLGLVSARKVQQVRVAAPNLKIEPNPFPSMASTYRILRKNPAIFNAVLAISWFWFFGAAILSILPVYCKDLLNVDSQVVTCFLAMFTVGVGVGSILCEKLSFKRVELGLVPIGSLGLSVFLLDLYFSTPASFSAETMTLAQFAGSDFGPRLLVDFFLMSLFGGFFILPLYTFIQDRSVPEERSRVIAGNNIVNALFMVVSSLAVVAFNSFQLSFPQMFLTLALMNLAVAFYVYSVVPEFTLRFFSWVMARLIYRIKIEGEDNIPKKGAAVLVCNHVSFADWLVISALVRRPVRFVMYYKFYQIPFVKFVLRQAKAVPICGGHENKEMLQAAFDKISDELRDGEVVCIFPEGKITRDGEMNEFRNGIERIVARDPVPVVPMALTGLFDGFFGYGGEGRPLKKAPRHWLKRVKLIVGKPIQPDEARVQHLAQTVAQLGGLDVRSTGSEN